jgi:two-component system nitrate/nitrite response regulator NarL
MVSLRNGVENPIRVLVTDTDKITVRLLAADLMRQQQFEIDYCLASDLADHISTVLPTVLLLSARLQDPASEMLGLLRKVRANCPSLRVIVLSEACGKEMITEVFRAGARGFFDRSSYDPVPLCLCIQRVAEGQIWATSEELGFVLDAFSETAPMHVFQANGIESLTPRERDVVRLVTDGFANREVAQQLGLSPHTVKNYLFSVFDKIGVSSRAELIMYVLSNNGRYSGVQQV